MKKMTPANPETRYHETLRNSSNQTFTNSQNYYQKELENFTYCGTIFYALIFFFAYSHTQRWVKFGNVKHLIVLSNDVIAMASGIYILFFDLNTKEERIEKFDSRERGKGASCLAAHSVVPMFATAERRYSPKIFIFTYPGIRKVSNCILEPRTNSYSSCVFAGSEYLVSLTSFPDFRIIVWSWRTGENLASIDTIITDNFQRITCSPSPPYQISQLGGISGNLVVYEISVCSRIVMLSPSTNGNLAPTANRVVCTSWSSDGNLFECDVNGNVILNSNDGKRRHLIVQAGEESQALDAKNEALIETFRSGIVVVNRQSQITFYRKPTSSDSRVKSATPWKSMWSIRASSHPSFIASTSESILLHCTGGEILKLSSKDEEDLPKIETVICQGSKYKYLALINPRGDHVVAIDQFNRLNILHCLTGKLVSNLHLQLYGSVNCAASHSNLPLIAIGTTIGKFVLVDVFEISQPSAIEMIHLGREMLEIIRYSWISSFVGVVDAERHRLFTISSEEKYEYSVLGLFNFDMEILDFLLYEVEKELTNIVILATTNKCRKISRNIVVYSLDTALLEKVCLCVIELTSVLDSLAYGRIINEIIVVPYLTKQLHFLQLSEDFQELTLTEVLGSSHQLRDIQINLSENFILTCSYDGLIILNNRTNAQQVEAIFMAHHRLDGGAKMAIISSSNNTIVSLGRNGDLAATKICHLKTVEKVLDFDDSALRTRQKETDFDDDLTWIERDIVMRRQREREECEDERNSIVEDFLKLRERLKSLLDANEDESPITRLPISDFDLDRDRRARKIHENTEAGKKLVEKLERQIFQRNEVSTYLRKLCWDSMAVPSCNLLSFDKKTEINNFAMPRATVHEENQRKWQVFMMNSEPPYTEKNKTQILTSDEVSIVGTTTHKFLPETLDRSVNQIRKCPSFFEGFIASADIRDRERKLKIHFNVLFEEMQSVKNREITIAAERLEEIDYCTNELKNMFKLSPIRDERLSQPLWHFTEKPETIMTITNDEILNGKAASYLERDNRLEILTKQREENLTLHDDFREKALEAMMDGLLEVRWENELKKEPPKPRCLTSKDPANYNEEEMVEIEIYRIKCEELEKKRERYKSILLTKMVDLEKALRRDFESFDRRLEMLRLHRMKIESAVSQERLTRLRESRRHLLRQRGIETLHFAHEELSEAVKQHKSMSGTLMTLENVVTETRNRYENLLKREKILDAKFRGDFPDLKQPMVEHLLRHYRKRPKNVQLTCTSITYLAEIGRCIINSDQSQILPKDCSDFLRGMDSLDTMPNNLPVQIDANHWNILCKLRRAKLELEIKIKICAVELAEAEQTFVSQQKAHAIMDSKVNRLREILKDRELKNRETLEDMEIQLVLKMGQIECELYGDPRELSNAVLVPYSIIDNANTAIIQAGRKKLNAMRQTVFIRRTIIWREWRHQCMQITLRNMQEELQVFRRVKLTREIQIYLMNDPPDVNPEKKTKISNRVLDSTKMVLERILGERRKQCEYNVRKIALWRERNEKSSDALEKTKLTSFKTSMLIHTENRERDTQYRQIKLKTIMTRNRLKNKVEQNYGQLLALQAQLELLRLKTYPTLRLKRSSQAKRHEEKIRLK